MIHVHCFQGDVRKAWVGLFANVRFGLAPKCIGNQATRALVTTLHMSRFVLESDFPYLCVQDGGESHPRLSFSSGSFIYLKHLQTNMAASNNKGFLRIL